jgi:hypothetical protein
MPSKLDAATHKGSLVCEGLSVAASCGVPAELLSDLDDSFDAWAVVNVHLGM